MGVSVQPSGLSLMSECHYLGASSDGVVQSVVLEIKCPFSGRDKTVEELITSGYNHIVHAGESLELNENSPYYCQVQGEMAIKGYSMCHFVVWTPLDFEIIPVPFNSSFWNTELLLQLKKFYNTFVRPELLAH